MKRLVVYFYNNDGSEFRAPETVEYDGVGTAAEPYEEFWAINETRAVLAKIQSEYPSGKDSDEREDPDIPE